MSTYIGYPEISTCPWLVFPCINYLQEDLLKRERQEKSGKI